VRDFAVLVPRAGVLSPELIAERCISVRGSMSSGQTGKAHDVPLQERRRRCRMGLPGDRRTDAAPSFSTGEQVYAA
jgi:hypothetical protein